MSQIPRAVRLDPHPAAEQFGVEPGELPRAGAIQGDRPQSSPRLRYLSLSGRPRGVRVQQQP